MVLAQYQGIPSVCFESRCSRRWYGYDCDRCWIPCGTLVRVEADSGSVGTETAKYEEIKEKTKQFYTVCMGMQHEESFYKVMTARLQKFTWFLKDVEIVHSLWYNANWTERDSRWFCPTYGSPSLTTYHPILKGGTDENDVFKISTF